MNLCRRGTGHDGLTQQQEQPPQVVVHEHLLQPQAAGSIVAVLMLEITISRQSADTKGPDGHVLFCFPACKLLEQNLENHTIQSET